MKKMLALLFTISIVQCGLIFDQIFGGGVHSSPKPSLNNLQAILRI